MPYIVKRQRNDDSTAYLTQININVGFALFSRQRQEEIVNTEYDLYIINPIYGAQIIFTIYDI